MNDKNCVMLDVDDTLADFAYDAARLLSIQTRVTQYPENWRTHSLTALYKTTVNEITRILRDARPMYENLRLTNAEWVNFSDYCYDLDLPIVVVTARAHIFGSPVATILTHKWLGKHGLLVKEVHAVNFGHSKADLLKSKGWNPILAVEDNQTVLSDIKEKFPETSALLYTRPPNENYAEPSSVMTRIHTPKDAVIQLQHKLRALSLCAASE